MVRQDRQKQGIATSLMRLVIEKVLWFFLDAALQ